MESSRLAELDPRVVGYLDVPQISRHLGRPEHVVRLWCREGRIRGLIKVGVAWVAPASEVERLASLEVGPLRDP
ncbi:MAG TPA: hypothetical protein VFA32_14495 [Dehalococcoidia bacterium]|jgi:hypothetical protein|nr:hypothetical protein [Dehalococcoidia bacterium]